MLCRIGALTLAAITLSLLLQPALGRVPQSLDTIEEAAEDIIDVVPGSAWAKADADVVELGAAWKSYLESNPGGGAWQDALSSALERLKKDCAARNQGGTLQAANDVSAAVVELFEPYHPRVPADVGRLDVLGRQLILDGSAGSWDAAVRDLARSNEIWTRVKPEVLAKHGEAVAAKFDASLEIQARTLAARDAKALAVEANNGLELVDDLENVYEGKKQP